MAVILMGDIAKSRRAVTNTALKRLINQREPKVAYFFARMWRTQQNAISYADLQRMVVTGAIDEEIMQRWYDDYSKFVVDRLYPVWRDMMEEAGGALARRFPTFSFDPDMESVAQYTAQHAAELVTYSTGQQIEAIRAMVQRASVVQDMTVDSLAYMIRPTIGLYKGQAVANLNYYNNVKQSLLKNNPRMRVATAEKRAREAAARYAAKQHRYRAHMIARTELAFAYNMGEYQSVRQAQTQGLIGECVKEWVTAADDRVCSRCKEMDGVRIPLDATFPNGAVVPPLHPHCRCVYDVIEIAEANFQ